MPCLASLHSWLAGWRAAWAAWAMGPVDARDPSPLGPNNSRVVQKKQQQAEWELGRRARSRRGTEPCAGGRQRTLVNKLYLLNNASGCSFQGPPHPPSLGGKWAESYLVLG
ncbi:uncharacterized protein BCR38DRAFT_410612 [Pseudomassariella vexata]|uniref:Uncharacterized protein n=1 Tax=Pseudomassariella vexata TaxID=1141098 RepID=A0A1Y2DSD3_9PEZI|nr:uncharacterized protein BCR38DRAFT_410612 [Pseudomassariella vexata]ORY62168.1 hypothetical protein BCR38DRAFT_410612 [Pseudomassariella vexata]